MGTIENVRDDLNFDTEVVPVLIPQIFDLHPIYGFPIGLNMANFGKWEFIRNFANLPIDGYYGGIIPDNFWLMATMFFATGARAEIETRFGGVVVQNENHVYTMAAPLKGYIASLGIDADTILQAMNDRPKITADKKARKAISNISDFTGRIRIPLMTLQTQGDGLTVPANTTVLEQTVTSAGRSDLLLQVFTNGNKHVGFTPDQVLKALSEMEAWLDTQNKPAITNFTTALGFIPDFVSPPWLFDIDENTNNNSGSLIIKDLK